MAPAERGGDGEAAASLPLITTLTSRFKFITENITSVARTLISKMPPPPPLTQQLEIGKGVLQLGVPAIIGLLLYDHFAAGEAHPYLILGLFGGCVAVFNGIWFRKTSALAAGIGLIWISFDVLVATFLPLKFRWACWLLAAFSLMPLLHLLVKLSDSENGFGAPPEEAQQIPTSSFNISGERKREEEEEEGAKYVRMEEGKFMRKFVLPENADTEKIAAVCRDRVLTRLPSEKLPPPEPKKRKTIEVKIA